MKGFNPRTPCGVRPPRPTMGGEHNCFNPRTPCGVRRSGHNPMRQVLVFQSTHSLRSATSSSLTVSTSPDGFNPRTPCGVRLSAFSSTFNPYRFQSTHSLRSATRGTQPKERNKTMFQSTHSLRSATRDLAAAVDGGNVSIHALLAECDRKGGNYINKPVVSIHALLAECDIRTLK